MLIREHLERAIGFEKSLAKLDPICDSELYVIFLMRAATNRMNAALHALDVTQEGPVEAGDDDRELLSSCLTARRSPRNDVGIDLSAP